MKKLLSMVLVFGVLGGILAGCAAPAEGGDAGAAPKTEETKTEGE